MFELAESDPTNSVFAASNFDLQCLIINYVKCNLILNGYNGMVQESYRTGGLQTYLKQDELSIKLFTILQKMQSPLATQFFEERKNAEAMFDMAVKQT